MKGIILAGGFGTRLHPSTIGVSKQLLPIYDKPLIYYPLSTLMSAGIKDILVITSKEDEHIFNKLLGNGEELGISLSFATQDYPNGIAQAFLIGEEFINDNSVTMILGDNLFHGSNLHSKLSVKEGRKFEGARIFAYKVPDPSRYGVVEFNRNLDILSIEEKPKDPKSNHAVTGLYVYDNKVSSLVKKLKPSSRGELEITDLNQLYLEESRLEDCLLDSGDAWLDAGTPDSMLEASHFVQTIQKRQLQQIGCPEEIALKKGYITKEEFEDLAEKSPLNNYGNYLRVLAKDNNVNS